MYKTLIVALIALLCAGCSEPFTDEQAKAMIEHCDKKGKTAYMFNGLVSRIKCT
jgi:hypothetical protein